MHQHEAGVDEVEALAGRVVARHVLAADLDDLTRGGAGPGDVDVGGEDTPARPGAPGQPSGHRGPTGADLPAPPPGPDPESVDPPERLRIEDRRHRREPRPGLGPRVVQQVAMVVRHASMMRPRLRARARSPTVAPGHGWCA